MQIYCFKILAIKPSTGKKYIEIRHKTSQTQHPYHATKELNQCLSDTISTKLNIISCRKAVFIGKLLH